MIADLHARSILLKEYALTSRSQADKACRVRLRLRALPPASFQAKKAEVRIGFTSRGEPTVLAFPKFAQIPLSAHLE